MKENAEIVSKLFQNNFISHISLTVKTVNRKQRQETGNPAFPVRQETQERLSDRLQTELVCQLGRTKTLLLK